LSNCASGSNFLRTRQLAQQNAGEVGDGPDQGYSGGADSVPPAPNSETMEKACPAIHSEDRPFLVTRELGLRGSCCLGSQEHGSEAREPSSEQVDRSRTAFRYVLAISMRTAVTSVIMMVAAASITSSVGKRRRDEKAERNHRKAPISGTVFHRELPIIK
jgi:hypothetical protein